MSNTLRSRTIRLAYANPALRSHLLPLLGVRTADDKSFDEAVKGKKFRNPETGNKVQFGSLPDYEQSQIRAKWNSKREKSEPLKENKDLERKTRQMADELTKLDWEDKENRDQAYYSVVKYVDDAYAEKKLPTLRGYPSSIPVWEDNASEAVEKYFGALEKEIDLVAKIDREEGPDQGADYSKEIRALKKSIGDHKSKVLKGLGEFTKAKKDWHNHSDKHDLHGLDEADQFEDDDGKEASLRSRAIRLAHANPALRPHLLPLLGVRTAFEHDTQEALDKYLKEHPNANRRDHTVKKEQTDSSHYKVQAAKGHDTNAKAWRTSGDKYLKEGDKAGALYEYEEAVGYSERALGEAKDAREAGKMSQADLKAVQEAHDYDKKMVAKLRGEGIKSKQRRS